MFSDSLATAALSVVSEEQTPGHHSDGSDERALLEPTALHSDGFWHDRRSFSSARAYTRMAICPSAVHAASSWFVSLCTLPIARDHDKNTDFTSFAYFRERYLCRTAGPTTRRRSLRTQYARRPSESTLFFRSLKSRLRASHSHPYPPPDSPIYPNVGGGSTSAKPD